MKNELKKLKLNRLQKESLSAKELRNLKGGACACVSICMSSGRDEAYWDGYATGTATCEYNE